MAEKIIKTRIINKNGSVSEWLTSNLELKNGEIALAYVENETTAKDANGNVFTQYVPTYLMKVGHGNKKFSELPWMHAPASDVHAWAKKEKLALADMPMSDVVTELQKTFYTEEEITSLLAALKTTIVATAEDDNVVKLEAAYSENSIKYTASHANSGVTVGSYTKVTVDAKGHVTAGENPTSLAGYGIGDAYTDEQVNAFLAGKADKDHTHNYATQDDINNALSSVLTYKGTVDKTSDLPTDELKTGDVYNITTACAANSEKALPAVNAGDNVAWNGTSWDVLAGTINLSNYYDKQEVDAKLSGKAPSDHTHAINIASSTSTNQLDLAHGGKYEIGVGNGAKFVFTMPSDENTHYTTKIWAGDSETTSNKSTYDPYITITDDDTYRNQIRFKGAEGTVVKSDAAGNITIEAFPARDSENNVMTYIFDCGGPTE